MDEDEEGSDPISFVIRDWVFLQQAIAFCQFHLCAVVVRQLSIAVQFLESCKHASCTLLTSSVSTSFMNNVLCSCYWEHQN